MDAQNPTSLHAVQLSEIPKKLDYFAKTIHPLTLQDWRRLSIFQAVLRADNFLMFMIEKELFDEKEFSSQVNLSGDNLKFEKEVDPVARMVRIRFSSFVP